MADTHSWDTSAGNNTSAAPDGAPEGWAPSAVNAWSRETMAAVARWYQDQNGTLSSTGSSNAYVVAANQTYAALNDIPLLVFRANFANTGAATLNVDSLGAKSIKKNHDQALASGDIEANQIVVVSYNATDDVFELVSATSVAVPIVGTDAQAQGAVLDDLNTLGANAADSEFIVGTGAGALAWESGSTVRTSLGVGTGDSPTFTGLTLTSSISLPDDSLQTSDLAAGSLPSDVTVNNGNWSGTDLAVANGGTGSGTASGAATNLGLGTSDDVQFSQLQLSAQPSFLAYNSSTDSNVTGTAATGYITVDFNTEVYDLGSDFASDTFTAPVSGKYILSTAVRLSGYSGTNVQTELYIQTSNRTYKALLDTTGVSLPVITHTLSVVADMDSSDVASVRIRAWEAAGGDVVDIVGASSPVTFFSGCLLA